MRSVVMNSRLLFPTNLARRLRNQPKNLNAMINILANSQFAIFFPEDVHAPMIGEDEIKKMVIKVKI
jgi:beta-galactosidase beta subunit